MTSPSEVLVGWLSPYIHDRDNHPGIWAECQEESCREARIALSEIEVTA